MIKITIDRKSPSINHLHGHNRFGSIYLKKEAKDLIIYIEELIKKQKIDVIEYKDKKLKVVVEVYENWMTKKGTIARKDICNREKFLVDSVFDSLGLDDKCIWEHIMIKKQNTEKEEAVISIEVLPDSSNNNI